MKHADALWLENLARHTCGRPTEYHLTSQLITQSLVGFLEELTELLASYCSYFNGLVEAEAPHAVVRLIKLGNPRPGVMVLRGKEKLIISQESVRSFKLRLSQVQGFQERGMDLLEFTPSECADGNLQWTCSDDGQRVNPELVAKNYVAPFLVHGGAAFQRELKPAPGTSLGTKNEKQKDSFL